MSWLTRVLADPSVQKALVGLAAALLAVATGDALLLDGQLRAALL